jgi:uncharacterized membrane protein
VAELIAIGYPDETTAAEAEKAAQHLAQELIIQPDAIAAIVRHKDGTYQVTTNHHVVGAGATWGMFWGFFFGLLFFVPGLGMAIGAGLGALFGKLEAAGIDKEFQQEVRDLLEPGTSALFLVLEKATPERAIAGMSTYGGKALKTSLSQETEDQLQTALHGAGSREPVAV